jgi:hypothetical protein
MRAYGDWSWSGICDRRSVGQSVLVPGSQLKRMSKFLFPVWHLPVSWCGAPFLKRGWACNLLVQLLLGPDRRVTLGSKFILSRDHILLSHLSLHQPGRLGSRIYIPQEQGGPVIPLSTGLTFRQLLRLSGLWWRYSNQPPRRQSLTRSSSIYIATDSQSARLSWTDSYYCRTFTILSISALSGNPIR